MTTTQAFVIRVFKLGDSSTVLRAYTQHAGPASYMVRTKSKKDNTKALLQPLNHLELVVDERAGRDLNYLKEARVVEPFVNLPNSMDRSTVALFVQEVLYKVLRDGGVDDAMFSFLIQMHHALDHAKDIRMLPILFLIRLSEVLGSLPERATAHQDHFDLVAGCFRTGPGTYDHTIPPPLSMKLDGLLERPLADVDQEILPYAERKTLLDHLLAFLRYHVEPLGELRSPAVLHAVLT